jgi:hypothetical protein
LYPWDGISRSIRRIAKNDFSRFMKAAIRNIEDMMNTSATSGWRYKRQMKDSCMIKKRI